MRGMTAAALHQLLTAPLLNVHLLSAPLQLNALQLLGLLLSVLAARQLGQAPPTRPHWQRSGLLTVTVALLSLVLCSDLLARDLGDPQALHAVVLRVLLGGALLAGAGLRVPARRPLKAS